ncbi:ATP-binding protein [Streptomyces sp. NPDC048106]|uniref:ATP-binding protein n=1 Tax=Streptomyces sp. NPDC048106 TaxID=3155750 RepID=UPI0034568E8E
MPDATPAPTPLLHEDQLDYTPLPRSIALARHRAARLVGEWGYAALAEDVALVVSELMTNALLHGSLRGRFIRLRLLATTATLRAEVSDPRGERRPSLRTAIDDDQFGRGLLLVEALTDDWGVAPRAGAGKTVWAQWRLGLTLMTEVIPTGTAAPRQEHASGHVELGTVRPGSSGFDRGGES